MSNPKVAVAITADDKTAKGITSAEKRFGKASKHLSEASKKGFAESDRWSKRDEKDTRRRLSDLGQLTKATANYGNGIGGAAQAATALSDAMRSVGGKTGGFVAKIIDSVKDVVAIADAWNKNGLAIRNMAAAYGVGSKALQTFTAAAERAGVDKETASGAIGGLSQTLNDAAYGRNTGALAVLSRLGVGLQRNSDGTVNVEAMLPKLADAIQRQNSSGARTVARTLGIPEAALAAFRQGGRALSSEMKDAGSTSQVYSDTDLARAAKQQRDLVRTAQIGWRGANMVGNGASSVIGLAFDNTVRDTFKPATEKFDRAVGQFVGLRGGGGLANGVLSLSAQGVTDLKKLVATEWDRKSEEQGHGIIDTVLNRVASGHWGRTVADVANARSQFSAVNGRPAWLKGRHSIDDLPQSVIDAKTDRLVEEWLAARAHGTRSSVGDNLNYANPNYSDARNQGWIGRLNGPVFGSGRSIHRHGTTPELERYRPGDFQVSSPSQTVQLEHHVTVEDKRTTVKSTARTSGSGAPAVSYSYTPVRGG